MSKFIIGNKTIEKDSNTYIVAELSANHLQNYDSAVKMIIEAGKSGVDAIKLQTYTPDTITINCDNEHFQICQGTPWDGKTLYELYREAYTPWEWHPKLKKVAEEEGMTLFSTPFDNSAVDFLEDMNVSVYKVASFEIADIPLIEYIASKGKPIIMATGIASLGEIDEAMKACKRMGNDQVALLKCTSAYPSPFEDMNLKTIKNLGETFNVVSGLSDHSLGISVPIAAVALGAKIIEKHFTLSRADGGPDSAFSLEPDELKQMVKSIREVEKAIGEVKYDLSIQTQKNRLFSRSLFFVENIKKGEIFTEKNIRSIRPGNGLHTRHYKDVLGRKAKVDISYGTPVSWDVIE